MVVLLVSKDSFKLKNVQLKVPSMSTNLSNLRNISEWRTYIRNEHVDIKPNLQSGVDVAFAMIALFLIFGILGITVYKKCKCYCRD